MALTLILQFLAFVLISFAWVLRRQPLPRIITVFSVGQACAMWSAYRLFNGSWAELLPDEPATSLLIWLGAVLIVLFSGIMWVVWSASSFGRSTRSNRGDIE